METSVGHSELIDGARGCQRGGANLGTEQHGQSLSECAAKLNPQDVRAVV